MKRPRRDRGRVRAVDRVDRAATAEVAGRPPRRLDGPTLLVLVSMATYAAVYCALCISKFHHALYTDFDLAIFAHATSRLLHGSLYESIGGMNWLGGHAAMNLFLLAPLYALAPHPIFLLVVQTLALASGAWAVFALARHEVGQGWAPALLAVLYLLHPALGYMNLFEFHPETLATPALIFAFAALRRGQLVPLVLWAGLAALAREDVSVLLLCMALYAAFARVPAGRRSAAALALLGAAVFVVDYVFLMPRLGVGQTDYAQMYARWGSSIREVVVAVATHPLRALQELVGTPGDAGDSALKRLYYVHLLLPVGALALASPGALLIAGPIVMEHFLSSRPSQHSIVFHYAALVLPLVMCATIVGLGSLSRRFSATNAARASRVALALASFAIVCSLASNVLFGPIVSMGKLQGIGRPEALVQDDYERDLDPFRRRMLERVPEHGDVIAGFELLDHFTDRAGLHSLHHFLAGQYTFSTRAFVVPRGVGAVIGDLGRGSLFKHVNAGTSSRWRELLSANHLQPVASADDLVLFANATKDSIVLCEPASPREPRPRPVLYDGQVAFVGSESPATEVEAGAVLPLKTYWRRVSETSRMFLSEITIVDAENRPVSELWRYLGYTLDPPAEWPLGVDMCEHYNLVVPRRLPPGRYFVGVRLWWRQDGQGVCSVDDPNIQADGGYVSIARFTLVPRRAGR